MHTRKGLIIVVLIGIVLASLGVGVFALTSSYTGNYWSAVWSKSYGTGASIGLTYASWKTLLSITLPYLPSGLYYHVVCDGYAFISSSAAKIVIAVDGNIVDGSTLRIYQVSGVLQTGLHTERVYQLGAGSHTFNFRGTKQVNTGLVNVNYHTITVTVYTDGGLTEPTYSSTLDANPDGIPK